jgi:hypothetical protein
MEIQFTHKGWRFDAAVNYSPVVRGRFTGPPENCYPDEGGEIEILELSSDGEDVMYLLDGEMADGILDAAAEQCEKDFNDYCNDY